MQKPGDPVTLYRQRHITGNSGRPDRLTQVLLNLYLNAIQAIGSMA